MQDDCVKLITPLPHGAYVCEDAGSRDKSNSHHSEWDFMLPPTTLTQLSMHIVLPTEVPWSYTGHTFEHCGMRIPGKRHLL